MKNFSGLSILLALFAIMIIAIFFRFYRLDSIPPGLYPDIAVNGNNAVRSLQTGTFLPFYTDNNGREGMIIWLDALSMAIFGVTPAALKIPGAIFGALTVFGIFLLARELFGKAISGKLRNNAIGLLSAFLLAVSFWHVNFSRTGFRVALEPSFLVFAFYFLVKALRNQKLFWGIASGIFFGLGFYTYTGYRLAVPLLFCALALWAIDFRKNKWQLLKLSAGLLFAAFITALPIGIYFLNNSGDFLGRAGQTSVFSSANPALELGKSLALHLGMFNIYGDANWRHNLPGAPELFFPVGIMFLSGLIVAVKRIVSSIKIRDFGLEFQSYSLLLLWLLFMLLPGVLTYEGIPHALRTFGVIPAAMIFAAVGGIGIYDWLAMRLPKTAVAGLSAILLFLIIVQGYWQYFDAWAKSSEIGGAFTEQFVEIGNLSSQLQRTGWKTVIIVNENGTPVPYPDGIPMPAQTVEFIETSDCYSSKNGFSPKNCGPYSAYLKPDKIGEIIIDQKTAVIPMKNDPAIFDQLAKLFPLIQIKQANNIKYYEINQ